MNDYCEGALGFLERVYDSERALFPCSTRLRNGAFVNDFGQPHTWRYTVNTLLGLVQAARHEELGWPRSVAALVDDFVAMHYGALENPGDVGLLLVALESLGQAHPASAPSAVRIEEAVRRGLERFNLQDLSWMLWGSVAAARSGRGQAEWASRHIHNHVRTRLLHASSGLPRYNLSPYRRNLVSFGSLVYFLRSTYEYATHFQDEAAMDIVRDGVRKVLAIQGSDGEWPWMIDVRSAMAIDPYPVFTVHQDSMAMLFLFPAATMGVEGTSAAVERSFRWNLGQNELEASLVIREPFFVYRSIERDERFARIRRYLRSLGPPALGDPPPCRSVRINQECRAYHLGWVLFAWSGYSSVPSPEAPTPAVGQRVG